MMQKSLQNYGFTCLCSLCECQRQTSPKSLKIRSIIMQEVIASFEKPNPTDMDDYYALLSKLDQTYEFPQSEEPRRTFLMPCISLINACAHDSLPQEVVKLGIMLLRALGFEMIITPSHFEVLRWGLMMDELVSVLADMWTAYGTVEPAVVKDVEVVLRTAYCIMAGEEVSFAGAYGSCEPEIEEKQSEDPEMAALVDEVRRKVNMGAKRK